jgi:hypothetical protein
MTTQVVGSIASLNASLIIAVFDAQNATEWVHTKPAATKAQFSGHPAEILRGLAKGEDATAIDVGPSSGYAFELEGASGRIEVYRLANNTLAFLAPPRAWWIEKHADHASDIEALFADALSGDLDDATEVGPIELSSGKLAAVYAWHKKVGSARDLAATMPSGGAVAFGDGYGEGGGLIVDVGAGAFVLSRREIAAPWDSELALVAMYVSRG